MKNLIIEICLSFVPTTTTSITHCVSRKILIDLLSEIKILACLFHIMNAVIVLFEFVCDLS